jgi:pantoate kinase
MMRNVTNLGIAIGAGLGFAAIAQVDNLRFTTLAQTVQTTVIRKAGIPDASPQTVQTTTVIRKAGIPDASSVTRIVRDSSGIYIVTVQRHNGRTGGLLE